MLARVPLSSVENESTLRRKVKSTYGKKTKPTTSLLAAKDIFTAGPTIEDQLAKLTVSETAEDSCKIEKNVATARTEQVSSHARDDNHDIKPARSSSSVTRPPSPSRELSKSRGISDGPKRTRKPKDVVESSSIEVTGLTLDDTPEDNTIINDFVQRYADRKVLSFERYGSTIAKKYHIKKIGEGTYSSVFALTRKREPPESKSDSQTSSLHQTTILKLIPILLPSETTDDETNTTKTPPIHIASEIQTMRAMDPIHGFIRYRGCLVLHGAWSQSFLDAFRDFAKSNRKKALNEDPEIAFTKTQHYAVIEMEDAGAELSDALKRPSAFQSWDVFWQTAIHLANAEQVCGFEHRDLHVSNICVRGDGDDGRTDVAEEFVADMAVTEAPRTMLGLSKIQVTIIDYTFSRVEVADKKGDPKTLYREFVPEGKSYEQLCKQMARSKSKNTDDFEDKVQQLTYAKVAELVDNATEEHTDTEKDNYASSKWQQHVAKTNVAWLGYLVTCLLGRAGKTAKTKYVSGSNEVARQVQDELRHKLSEIRDVLMVEDLTQVVASAGAVISIGIERGWLSLSELEKFKARLERDS